MSLYNILMRKSLWFNWVVLEIKVLLYALVLVLYCVFVLLDRYCWSTWLLFAKIWLNNLSSASSNILVTVRMSSLQAVDIAAETLRASCGLRLNRIQTMPGNSTEVGWSPSTWTRRAQITPASRDCVILVVSTVASNILSVDRWHGRLRSIDG